MSRDKWNIIHSWWILLIFTFFINWAAFLYTGIRTGYKRWIYYGLIYAIPFILIIIFQVSGPIFDFAVILSIILWPISLGHAFKIRKEYLVRRGYAKSSENKDEKELRMKIEREYGINNYKIPDYPKIPKSARNSSSEAINNNAPEVKPELADINNCSEQAIAELPGIGIILAKKAIEIRKTRDFESVDDFGQTLDLKPHIIEHIRPFILINPSNRVFEPEQSGRRVDF